MARAIEGQRKKRTFLTTFSATFPTSTFPATSFPFPSPPNVESNCSSCGKGAISIPSFAAGPDVVFVEGSGASGGRWGRNLYIADGFVFVNLPLASLLVFDYASLLKIDGIQAMGDQSAK